jgi:glycosyltransferase involved in cell wall biosynthesis
MTPNQSRPSRTTPRAVLVTSGLGTAFGGIGVVSEVVSGALAKTSTLTICRHHHRWPRLLRGTELVAKATTAGFLRPRAIIYTHVDLARIHSLVPTFRKTPYAVILHGLDVWYSLDSMRRRALEQAALLIAVSQTTVSLARKANPWFPDTAVTWLGVQRQVSSSPICEREPIALMVGRMDVRTGQKGHDQVLDAWAAIVAAVPTARLLMIGEGSDRPRLMRRVAQEGLRGVEFTGYVSDTVRDELYRKARVFLFPSSQEGFGLAAFEAAAAGMPVIGLSGTVLEELFPGGRGVRLVSAEGSGPLADATIELLSNASAAMTLGAEAQRRVYETFLQEHFVARFENALAPLLSSSAEALQSRQTIWNP